MTTREERDAAAQRQNGRVGLEVVSRSGVSYWVTDVSTDDERLRVLGADGRAYWFHTTSRLAVPVVERERRKR